MFLLILIFYVCHRSNLNKSAYFLTVELRKRVIFIFSNLYLDKVALRALRLSEISSILLPTEAHFVEYNAIYASPTSGEAYRNRRLTTNFELWVEIFCVPTCFHVTIPKPCLSVCLSAPREKISSLLRQYQSYISNWYINGKVFTSTTPWKTKNLIFFFKKVWNSNFGFWRRAEITLASSISVLH